MLFIALNLAAVATTLKSAATKKIKVLFMIKCILVI